MSIKSDNDLYTSFYYDRYYTNGLFLSYSIAKKHKESKRIHHFILGHQMYTPQNAYVNSKETIDRPYAGHLFFNYQQQYYGKKNYALYPAVQIGIIGEAAQAEKIQNTIHDMYGFPEGNGWHQQIENTFELNLGLQFIKPFEKESKKFMDFTSVSNFHIGTSLTELNTGIYGRINLMKSELLAFDQTVIFNSNLNVEHQKWNNELFLFVKPQIGLLLHDATIQGSLFTYNSPITTDINTFIYEIEAGFMWSFKQFNFSYSYTKYSKRSKSMLVKSNNFGTIVLALVF